MSQSRLLVAVSSPWAGQRLAGPVLDLAQRLEGEVIVCHVAQGREEDEHESEARQRGEEALKVVLEAMDAGQVSHRSFLLFSDDVSKAIVNTADAHHCTLIVLGLAPRPGFWRAVFGRDVGRGVLRRTRSPVLFLTGEGDQRL